MVSCSFRICAGSVNKLVINQLYHSVAEVPEITNALIAVHVTSQTLYTEITNAVHVTSLPGSLYVCLHFATAHVPILTN